MSSVDTVEEVRALQDITDKVVIRLRRQLPGASNVVLQPATSPFAIIHFELEDCHHTFRLRREAGLWYIREWICDGRPESLKDKTLSSPRFEMLIALILGYGDKQPRVRVVEMRCPVDPRRLFGKVIIQEPLPRNNAKNLIEFLCPQCKRETRMVTMHLFSPEGELIKTEAIEPWVKQEPGRTWHRNGDGIGH